MKKIISAIALFIGACGCEFYSIILFFMALANFNSRIIDCMLFLLQSVAFFVVCVYMIIKSHRIQEEIKNKNC